MATTKLLAFDLGAESGRAIVGHYDGEKLSLEVIHRFPNEPVRVCGTLYWDVLRLFGEMKTGLRLAAQKYPDLAGLGVDTWGVDFGLLDAQDNLLGNPVHYRDARTEGMMELAFQTLPAAEIYRLTGIQFMQFNTLYQLLALQKAGSPQLAAARTLLLMPNLLTFFFSGQKVTEFSIATTTQLYNPTAGTWAEELFQAFDLPRRLLTEIVPAGTVVGELLPEVAAEVGAQMPVIVPAGHDTASAVAAVPVTDTTDYAYISSGTWSLMGVELPSPLINAQTHAFQLTNEGGVGGSIRLLKNIMGLWLVQECRRAWARQGEELNYAQITELAAQAPPLKAVVDPDAHAFLNPPDMPRAIQDYCRETGQPVPESKGAIVRTALESLALKYRWTLEKLETILGRQLPVIHIVGGGTQNQLLCQLTADCTGRRVVAGPVEATATGNLLVQAMALGRIGSLGEARAVVQRSFPVVTYTPRPDARPAWDAAYARFQQLF